MSFHEAPARESWLFEELWNGLNCVKVAYFEVQWNGKFKTFPLLRKIRKERRFFCKIVLIFSCFYLKSLCKINRGLPLPVILPYKMELLNLNFDVSMMCSHHQLYCFLWEPYWVSMTELYCIYSSIYGVRKRRHISVLYNMDMNTFLMEVWFILPIG